MSVRSRKKFVELSELRDGWYDAEKNQGKELSMITLHRASTLHEALEQMLPNVQFYIYPTLAGEVQLESAVVDDVSVDVVVSDTGVLVEYFNSRANVTDEDVFVGELTTAPVLSVIKFFQRDKQC